MDQRVKYKISDRKFNRRAEVLSRLDDAAEQRREIGICCAALEQATNEKNWPLVERLTQVLLKLRESQQKARERAQELVDVVQFRNAVLTPLLNCIAARLQAALPNYEETMDLIEADLRGIHPRLLEDKR
jgi:hypothetical protein